MNETQEIQEDLETQDEPQARQSETEILANEEIVQQADRERADTETSQEIYKNIVPKPKMHIEYKCNETDRWQEAIVINRGGKANGKHHMWMNIQDMPQDTQKSVSFEEVDWREKVETVLMSENDFRGIIEAKHKEIANLIEHKVFVEHDDVGQEYIDTQWIITEKTVDKQPVIKARLVAKGFQECLERDPTIRTDSPTGVKENHRLLLAISATNQWELKSIDIKSAYLQGNKIEQRSIH